MTPERHARLVCYVLEHARFVASYETPTQNYQSIEASGLMAAGALFPEFAEAEAWRADAVRRCEDTVQNQFLADGTTFEATPHYLCVVARCLWNVAELHRFAEPAAPPLTGIEEAIGRAVEAGLRMQRPNGLEPLIGDSVSSVPIRRPFYVDEWRNSGGLNWAIARLARHDLDPFRQDAGLPNPYPTDAFLPSAGMAIVRSDWGPDAFYLAMDLGFSGWNHSHEDGLHLLMEHAGRSWLTGPGRGMPSSAYPLQRYSYYWNTAGHSSARPLGRSQARRLFQSTAQTQDPSLNLRPLTVLGRQGWAFLRGEYREGYSPLSAGEPSPADGLPRSLAAPVHRRMVIVERTIPRIWVLDLLGSPAPQSWEIFWHLDASLASPSEGSPAEPFARWDALHDKAPATGEAAARDRLALYLPRNTDGNTTTTLHRAESAAPGLGWTQDAWAAPRAVTTVKVTTAPALARQVATVLQPAHSLSDNAGPIVLSSDTEQQEHWIGEFADPPPSPGKSRVVFNPARSMIVHDGMTTDAEAVWLRYSGMGGMPARWAVVEGTTLTVDGVVLWSTPARSTGEGQGASALMAR